MSGFREVIAAQPKVLTPLIVARELAARAAKVDGFNETTEFIRTGIFDDDYSVRLLNEFIAKHHDTPEQLAALLADGGE